MGKHKVIRLHRIAHRHLVLAVGEDPEWAWLLVRLEVPHNVTDAVLGEHAMGDLRDGIDRGRFRVASPRVALRASGGALISVMHGLLMGEFGPEAGSEHAEGVLRSFGVDDTEAAEIARRPLPEALAPGG